VDIFSKGLARERGRGGGMGRIVTIIIIQEEGETVKGYGMYRERDEPAND